MSGTAPNAKASRFATGRVFESMVVIGPPGHGKSSLLAELADDYRKKGGRVWIVDPNDNWPGDPGRLPWPGVRNLDRILTPLRTSGPGLLLCDDADRYMRHPTDERLDLMTSFRHWQKDIILVSRRPQGLPKDSIANSDSFAIFALREVYARRYMSEQIGDRKVMQQIPKERFQYLYYRQDGTGACELKKTKQRVTVTASDAKRY